MTEQRERPVANPDRTQVDDEDEVTRSESTPFETKRHETKRHETEQHDPHDQPWPKVAAEVRNAVDQADGPLER